MTLTHSTVPFSSVCIELNINSERCGQLRKECTDFSITMDAALGMLEQKLNEDPNALKETKLTPAEKELMEKLIERQHSKGGHVIDLTDKPEDTQALGVLVLNSIMLLSKDPSLQFEENGTPMSLWQNINHRVEELKKPKEIDEETPTTDRNEHEDRRTHEKRNPLREPANTEENSEHREKFDKSHREKGEHHEKKWAKDKGDDDGFSGNVRRRRAENEAEPVRGGLL